MNADRKTQILQSQTDRKPVPLHADIVPPGVKSSLTTKQKEIIRLWNDDELLTFSEIADRVGFVSRDAVAGQRTRLEAKGVFFLSERDRKILREYRGKYNSEATVDALFEGNAHVLNERAKELYEKGYRLSRKPSEYFPQISNEMVTRRKETAPAAKDPTSGIAEDDSANAYIGELLNLCGYRDALSLIQDFKQGPIYLAMKDRKFLAESDWEDLHTYIAKHFPDISRENLGRRTKDHRGVKPSSEFLKKTSQSFAEKATERLDGERPERPTKNRPAFARNSFVIKSAPV